MAFHSFRNEMANPFLQELSGHSILAGMEYSFHSHRNEIVPFHSCRNGMLIPFPQE
jgi:hypothetical protein